MKVKKKEIYTACFDCGNKYGKCKEGGIGVWKGTCDICGKTDVPCASAPHDFGIYSSEAIRQADIIQRKI